MVGMVKRASLVLAIVFGLVMVLFGYSGNGVEKIKEKIKEKIIKKKIKEAFE